MRSTLAALGGAIALLLLTLQPAPAAEAEMTVHEWGTFTVLQDETGKELAGINTDDEPVPKFVHDLAPYLLAQPLLSNPHWEYRQKGAPRHHPAVTMRLETPVIYFYPAAGKPLPSKLDVQVVFNGGWLTQFYPQADFSAPQLKEGPFDFSQLSPKTMGRLTWRDLEVGTTAAGPETKDPVWLHPRKVQAAGVTSREGESEKYLFYRGVGQRAPLKVSLDRKDRQISIRSNFGEVFSKGPEVSLSDLWLVRVAQDGTCRYRRLDEMVIDGREDVVRLTTSYAFDPATPSDDQKAELERDLHAALVKDGLYSDEATALLSTWQRSYFATPGLRLFYLVPRAWTDHYLPLTITGNPPLVRSMVGRIELMGDEQRELLTKLSKTPNSNGQWVEELRDSPARDKFLAGRSDFGDLGVKIPDDYKLYLALGRFRNALVTAEEARSKSANLKTFVDTYALHPFRLQQKGNK